MSSYGHTYLTSYGWTGTGTALRKGAIAKPLAIPPKKNLGGLGKDRDEAFPFWDHLFTAASKAITIRVSSDDEDEDTKTSTDLRRTTTGILSNRRPLSGTPASTSGSSTPNPAAGESRLSLLAAAKREAAKRGLYARFFRGPVLGPDDDLCESDSGPSSCESVPVPVHTVEDTKKSKRGSDDSAERREKKRLKKERRTARAEKKAEKALARERTGEEKIQPDLNRKTSSKKARRPAEKSLIKPDGDSPQTHNEQQDTLCKPPGHTDALDIVLTTKKKRKRKDTS